MRHWRKGKAECSTAIDGRFSKWNFRESPGTSIPPTAAGEGRLGASALGSGSAGLLHSQTANPRRRQVGLCSTGIFKAAWTSSSLSPGPPGPVLPSCPYTATLLQVCRHFPAILPAAKQDKIPLCFKVKPHTQVHG